MTRWSVWTIDEHDGFMAARALAQTENLPVSEVFAVGDTVETWCPVAGVGPAGARGIVRKVAPAVGGQEVTVRWRSGTDNSSDVLGSRWLRRVLR